jgi:hypothetical protein
MKEKSFSFQKMQLMALEKSETGWTAELGRVWKWAEI